MPETYLEKLEKQIQYWKSEMEKARELMNKEDWDDKDKEEIKETLDAYWDLVNEEKYSFS